MPAVVAVGTVTQARTLWILAVQVAAAMAAVPTGQLKMEQPTQAAAVVAVETDPRQATLMTEEPVALVLSLFDTQLRVCRQQFKTSLQQPGWLTQIQPLTR
jgi:hypothetical protein